MFNLCLCNNNKANLCYTVNHHAMGKRPFTLSKRLPFYSVLHGVFSSARSAYSCLIRVNELGKWAPNGNGDVDAFSEDAFSSNFTLGGLFIFHL